jgi:general secretion pathway protein J
MRSWRQKGAFSGHSPCNSSHGFTLIEVLIAMTLLSVMVVLLFGSLKICAQSWEMGEKKIAEVNEVAVVYNFFQQHLSAAKPLKDDFAKDESSLQNGFTEEESKLSFQGDAQSLQFISVFPASAGRAGLQLFSLAVQDEGPRSGSDDGAEIKVTLTPFFPVAEGEEWQKEEAVLIKHVSHFALSYFGPDQETGESQWRDEWLNKNALPRLVKIQIEREDEVYWPDMVIELKVGGDSSTLTGGAEDSGVIE